MNNNNNGHTIVNTMVTQLFSNCITNADNGMTMYDYWMTIEWLCMTMNDYWMTIEWLLNDYVWPWMTMNDHEWQCMTMYDNVWQLYAHVWLCMTMYDNCMLMYDNVCSRTINSKH